MNVEKVTEMKMINRPTFSVNVSHIAWPTGPHGNGDSMTPSLEKKTFILKLQAVNNQLQNHTQ